MPLCPLTEYGEGHVVTYKIIDCHAPLYVPKDDLATLGSTPLRVLRSIARRGGVVVGPEGTGVRLY
jgi:hypothetical protein